MIDTLCPISTLNQQLTNLEQNHVRCSLHCEGGTVKRGLRVSISFFQRNYLPNGRVNETVATAEELEADEIPPFVINCSCI